MSYLDNHVYVVYDIVELSAHVTARVSFTSAGIRSWDVDLKSCNLNLYLQEFLSHHTASFKGAGKSLFGCDSSSKLSDTFVVQKAPFPW